MGAEALAMIFPALSKAMALVAVVLESSPITNSGDLFLFRIIVTLKIKLIKFNHGFHHTIPVMGNQIKCRLYLL